MKAITNSHRDDIHW